MIASSRSLLGVRGTETPAYQIHRHFDVPAADAAGIALNSTLPL
jgi:hypothetical protein